MKTLFLNTEALNKAIKDSVDFAKPKEVLIGLRTPVQLSTFKTDEISDGYHTFGELYAHRIALFIALCKLYEATKSTSQWVEAEGRGNNRTWRSKRHSDGELAFGGGWFVLGIFTDPGKQITYHLPESYWNECDFADTLEQAPEWDGHTSDDVLTRLSCL